MLRCCADFRADFREACLGQREGETQATWRTPLCVCWFRGRVWFCGCCRSFGLPRVLKTRRAIRAKPIRMPAWICRQTQTKLWEPKTGVCLLECRCVARTTSAGKIRCRKETRSMRCSGSMQTTSGQWV